MLCYVAPSGLGNKFYINVFYALTYLIFITFHILRVPLGEVAETIADISLFSPHHFVYYAGVGLD